MSGDLRERIDTALETFMSAVTADLRAVGDGLGLPPDQTKRIFNRFYRVPDR